MNHYRRGSESFSLTLNDLVAGEAYISHDNCAYLCVQTQIEGNLGQLALLDLNTNRVWKLKGGIDKLKRFRKLPHEIILG